jgi:pyruvate dehydrogenase E2 component (dihydrolipoamide acetyltransferase)
LNNKKEEITLIGKRRTIARRMSEIWQQVPHVTLNRETDFGKTEAAFRKFREAGEASPAVRITMTDFIHRAVVLALTENPRLNATWEEEKIACWEDVNLGMAMSVPDGLIVPVFQKANNLDIFQLASERFRLQELAQKGKLGFGDVTGGTFTVTNLGAYGIDFFNPIINAPQVAILAVGRLKEAKTICFSLSFDHRAMDGVPAAKFLQSLAELLFDPSKLTTA